MDYNKEVLDFATKKVVEENLKGQASDSVEYLHGSWETILKDDTTQSKNALKNKFSLIIMCETLYNKEYYESLMDLIKWSLTKDGYVILGTKTFYYGFGGGFFDFNQWLEKNFDKY